MSGRLMDKRRKDGSFPFKWVPAIETNVAETIRRAREEQARKPQPIARIGRAK